MFPTTKIQLFWEMRRGAESKYALESIPALRETTHIILNFLAATSENKKGTGQNLIKDFV